MSVLALDRGTPAPKPKTADAAPLFRCSTVRGEGACSRAAIAVASPAGTGTLLTLENPRGFWESMDVSARLDRVA
jgi:hypothetical protein